MGHLVGGPSLMQAQTWLAGRRHASANATEESEVLWSARLRQRVMIHCVRVFGRGHIRPDAALPPAVMSINENATTLFEDPSYDSNAHHVPPRRSQ
jgi:hypothetical protein